MLLIEIALIPVGPKFDSREPWRRSPHLLTNYIQRHVWAAFDDKLIVYVSYDLTVVKRPHSISQNVPAYRLHDVLNKLRAVRFNPGPFFLRIDSHVGDGFSTETVLADPGFYISQAPSGRQRNEQHTALYYKGDIAYPRLAPLFDRFFDGGIHGPPVGSDVRVTAAPHVYKGLQLVLGKPHVEGAHGSKSADTAAIAEGKLGNFALLPQVAVNAVLFNRHAEHP